MFKKWQKILIIFGPITLLIAIFFGFHLMKQNIQHQEDKIAEESVTISYAKDLEQMAKQKKKHEKQTPQQIAKSILLNSVGLGAQQTGYSLVGINNDDGIFVKQGIIDGNMVPYSSDFNQFNQNNQNINVADFDAQDQEYWKQVKNTDFNKIKKNAEATVANYQDNNSQYQEQELTNAIRQAQYDAKQSGKLIQQNQIQQNSSSSSQMNSSSQSSGN